MRNVSDKVVEKVKTHILCSVTFVSKIVHFMNTVEKCFITVQATDDNMTHAHYMQDN
jgi:hypothetical protein